MFINLSKEDISGGGVVLGLILGLFSIYNSRATKKFLLEEERRTRELIAKMDEHLEGHRRACR